MAQSRGGRHSKTEPQPDRYKIHVDPTGKIFTCVIDWQGRTSAIPGAKEGQKCIVILLEEFESEMH
jgi:hypothetical protein